MPGGELDIPDGFSLSAENVAVNQGTLRQTLASVPAGSATDFLSIRNAAGDTTHYQGVALTPSGNPLSDVTVAVRGEQACTDVDGESVRRCFDISVPGGGVADITFHYLESERAGLDAALMAAYHWDGAAPWPGAGTFNARDAVGPEYSVTMTGVDSYSPFVLAPGSNPTALGVRGVVARSGLLLAVGLALAALVVMRKRQ